MVEVKKEVHEREVKQIGNKWKDQRKSTKLEKKIGMYIDRGKGDQGEVL